MAIKKVRKLIFFSSTFDVVGSGARDGKKIWIRDKHPGPAPLLDYFRPWQTRYLAGQSLKSAALMAV
jgi:hypothetical protein